jgi:hypothetical protein
VTRRKSDILWQNSGVAVSIWEMNGTGVIAGATIANPNPTRPGMLDFEWDRQLESPSLQRRV